MKFLGSRLREARERNLMTMRDLRDATGVGLDTIHRLETGSTARPHPGTIKRLADALGIDPSSLMDFDGDQHGASDA